MKTLFVVHLSPVFEANFRDSYVLDIILEANKDIYDRVVFLDADGVDAGAYVFLKDWKEHVEWNWGDAPPDCHAESERKWVIEVSNGFVTVPEILRDTTQDTWGEIYVVGGANGECLQGFLDILSHLNLNYDVINHLTYG